MRPCGYWTEGRVREEAAKYGSKKDFQRGCQTAYNAAHRLGIIGDLFDNQLRSWDESAVRAEAKKYSTKIDFKRGCSAAYGAAHRLGIIDELFDNQRRSWPEEAVREEAKKYDTKKGFQRGCHPAYNAAHRLNIIDELFDDKYNYWPEEAVRAEAVKYSTKAAFIQGCLSAYNAARRLGIIDELFENQFRSWDEATVRAEAAKYDTKADFRRGFESAYSAAHRLNLIDDLGFIPGATSGDNDTIYIWRAVGQFFNGKPVFKIGVTSARLGDVRIRDCARAAGFDAALIAKVPTWLPAGYVEDHLHEFGDDPGWRGFDGATEFRALDAQQLEQVLHVMNGYACPGEEGVQVLDGDHLS